MLVLLFGVYIGSLVTLVILMCCLEWQCRREKREISHQLQHKETSWM